MLELVPYEQVQFLRSGYIFMANGYMAQIGFYGHYWPHGGTASTYAYDFDFHDSNTWPTGGPIGRYYGFSLRCLQE